MDTQKYKDDGYCINCNRLAPDEIAKGLCLKCSPPVEMANKAIANCPFCGGEMENTWIYPEKWECVNRDYEAPNLRQHNALCEKLEGAKKQNYRIAELEKALRVRELYYNARRGGANTAAEQANRIAELEAEVEKQKNLASCAALHSLGAIGKINWYLQGHESLVCEEWETKCKRLEAEVARLKNLTHRYRGNPADTKGLFGDDKEPV
jgi:hypothetical protein